MVSWAYKRIPKKESLTQEEAIKNRGYYDAYGNWNSMLTVSQYPDKALRGRIEVFIFDEQNNVYMYILPDKVHYRIPGGSTSINRSFKYQVAQEAKEEAGIILGTITYTEYQYVKFFRTPFVVNNIHWEGTLNRVYTAQFKSWYGGYISNIDFDKNMYNFGHFMNFDKAKHLLHQDHRNALRI